MNCWKNGIFDNWFKIFIQPLNHSIIPMFYFISSVKIKKGSIFCASLKNY